MKNKIVMEGLTFDDVLLLPRYSEITPDMVSLKARLTKHITLNIPLLSAAMDTVTESQMAIALAREGGIGIIHKNMSIEQQAKEVDKVKRSENGVITDPITLSADKTLADALHIMSDYHISGIPVTDEDKKLVGIITNRDIKFEHDLNKKIGDVMTKENLVVGKVGTSLAEAKKILAQARKEKLPIVDDDFRLKGLITIKDIDKIQQYPNSAKDKFGRLLCGAGLGITKDYLIRAKALVEAGVDVFVLDSAHGDSKNVCIALKKLKETYPEIDVIAGNVATYEGAKHLMEAGADAVKVGMGPGSICTTRVISGMGVPQITAVMEARRAGEEFDCPIIADGGIKYSGDITKALAAGADTCMMGAIFGGCEEAPGETELYHGRKYKVYRGMGSLAAMEQAHGSSDRYFQSGHRKLVPEGVEGRVPYRGSASDVIFELLGGIRSGMGYLGVPTIKELQDKGEFIKITAASLKESHPHDIDITKEAPNYYTDSH
ncbi:IMP dehydrogenase [Treponema rectale]|jgi:IMP dehydrogenase|uniref:Inosine-5'-monophosphate dehydrogenase n=1 Tax=Treponema rectale TaxID=744512 RepID=A0A7M1XJ16_9SPIR|nr:IMP dehydrogenase [Treponema rectale]